MKYSEGEIYEAFVWFATHYDSWINLDNALTNGLKYVFEETAGPSRLENEVHWNWIRENKDDLLALYYSLRD